MQRAGRCVPEHLPALVGERGDDRVELAVALLDPLQRGVEELAGIEFAGGDALGLLAQRAVLRVAAHRGRGARAGSRSVSGSTPERSAASSAASDGP